MYQNKIIQAFLFITIFLILPTYVHSQPVPLGDLMREYFRILQMQGNVPLESQPSNLSQIDSVDIHPWKQRSSPTIGSYKKGLFTASPYDLQMNNYWQSLEPGTGRDGAVWQGRGFTNAFSGGFYLEYGIISASVRPTLIFTQNSHYELSPYSPGENRSQYAYLLGGIDWPQRFGTGSFWSLDAGSSFIRADYGGWVAGLSSEHMWWSPARKNAILLGDAGPGFPHYFIETTKPKSIGIGRIQTRLVWGKLQESDYFDSNPGNDERYITGGRIAYTPKWVKGLTVGVNRIFYETIPEEGIPAGDLLKVFEAFTKVNFTGDSNPGGNDEADQMLSLFGKWTFPRSGLEIYGEWARTDHSWNWRDFIMEPEHSRGYTIGIEKIFSLTRHRLLSVNAEFTQLEINNTRQFRAGPTFYYHYKTPQGYTHKGQMLGASIGPGSNSQYLGSSLYFGKGKIDLWVQRVALNNDFLYKNTDLILEQNASSPNGYWLHNVEMQLGSSLTYFFDQFEASFGFTLRREYNDDYIYNNDQINVGLRLSLRYRLSELR